MHVFHSCVWCAHDTVMSLLVSCSVLPPCSLPPGGAHHWITCTSRAVLLRSWTPGTNSTTERTADISRVLHLPPSLTLLCFLTPISSLDPYFLCCLSRFLFFSLFCILSTSHTLSLSTSLQALYDHRPRFGGLSDAAGMAYGLYRVHTLDCPGWEMQKCVHI